MESMLLFEELGVQIATQLGIAGPDMIVVAKAAGVVAGGVVNLIYNNTNKTV